MENQGRNGVAVVLGLAAMAAVLWLGWGFVAGDAPEPLVAADEQIGAGATNSAESLAGLDEQNRQAVDASSVTSAGMGSALLIRLVRGDSGEALPDHDLWFAANYMSGNSDPEKQFEKQGKKVRSDAMGIARIEDPPEWISCFAREEHLVGYLELSRKAHLASGDSFATIELRPERALLLRVIDPLGKPVPGVGLRAMLLIEGGSESKYSMWPGTTGENGSVAWQGFGLFLRNTEQKESGPYVGLRIKASIPGEDNLSIDFSPLPAHGQSIDLQTPPTGVLTARLLDADGILVPGVRTISIRHLDPNEETGEWKRGRRHYRTLKDGVAVFPAVTLNDYFEILIHGIPAPAPKAEVFGPTNDILAVSHDLSLDDERVFLRGRAVNENGEGLDTRQLRGEIKLGKKTFRDYSGTSPDGRFLFVFPKQVADVFLDSAKITLTGDAPVDLIPKSPLPTGTLDLGDLIFSAKVTLLKGKVVFAQGATCKAYRLAVERRAPGAEKWKADNTKVEIKGSEFTILGTVNEGDYRLKITTWAKCFILPEPIPFTPGQEDFEAHLDPGHSLTVHALIPGSPKNMWSALFYFRLRPTSEDAVALLASTKKTGIYSNRSQLGENNRMDFKWTGLLAGTYQLELWLTDEKTPIHTIPGIQLPDPDGLATDIDLDFDLDEFLAAFHMRLRTPSGDPPEQRTNITYLKDNRMLRKSGAVQAGIDEFLVVAPPGFFGLWILTKGYAPVLIHSLDRDQDVILTSSKTELAIHSAKAIELPEGIGLQVRVESQVEIPAGWQVPGSVQAANPSQTTPTPAAYLKGYWPKTVSATFNSKGNATLTISRTGRQSIRIGLVPTTAERRADWPKEEIWIDGVSPVRFDAQANGTAQNLQITIPAAALEAALREAGVR